LLTRVMGVKTLDVALTASAQRFVTTDTLFQSTGRRALCDWPDYDVHGPGGHIRFASMIDMLIVSPASANFIGSLASGQAYSPLLMIALAASCPVFLIPSMNARIWNSPIVQHQVDLLRRNRIHVIENLAGLSLGDDELQPGLDVGMPVLIREIFNEALIATAVPSP
jgi:phosphopantothenoylcysteine decarboxylase/phosphopantothenate--cysteine ligase